jgi:hypothetical protein
MTMIPSWDSEDDVQYINVDVILHTLSLAGRQYQREERPREETLREI